MRTPALLVAATSLVISSAATATGAPDGAGMRVPMMPKYRGCDFGFHVHPIFGIPQDAHGLAVITTSGKTVTAELEFSNTSAPGAHYDVGLIQAPRSAASPCGPGTPGTTYTGMDLDAAGRATVTLQTTIDQGTNAVWLKVDRPSPRSQYPAEAYSSDFLTPV